MILHKIYKASQAYLNDYKTFQKSPPPRQLKNYQSYKLIVQDLPKLIKSKSKSRAINYKYQGSISTGLMAKIPWICIFDTDITESATTGYYIVFLFKEDMSGVYLSLNQGFTQFKDKYGDVQGRQEAQKKAKYFQKILQNRFSINTKAISLNTTSSLGKGYEAGNICSLYFDLNTGNDDFNDKLFLGDLEIFKDYYHFLKQYIINRSINNNDEDEFQQEVQNGKEDRPTSGGVKIPGKRSSRSSRSWPRNRNRAYTALKDAAFKCEANQNHTTFQSSSTNRQFMEAHHLIPMEQQDRFLPYSLDVPENIICLCPNCHRAFHNSEQKLRKSLVDRFYKKRINALKARQINTSQSKLLGFYK